MVIRPPIDRMMMEHSICELTINVALIQFKINVPFHEEVNLSCSQSFLGSEHMYSHSRKLY